jgi:hypothetical protein
MDEVCLLPIIPLSSSMARPLRALLRFVHRNMGFRAVEKSGPCGKVARL